MVLIGILYNTLIIIKQKDKHGKKIFSISRGW